MVLVDEFQDFNKLEVSLIDALAKKSPILLVGDDDQALYEFKKATPDHIRHRHSEQVKEYKSFTLPYCSRCTRVIVDAINDVLSAARKLGLLKGRVPKEYLYFDQRDKDKECEKYPKLAYTQLYARQIPWFIETKLIEIAKDRREHFSALIICPLNSQCRAIASALRAKGLKNVLIDDKDTDDGLDLKAGLKILLSNAESNLGWRLVTNSVLPANEYKTLLEKTHGADGSNLIDLIAPKLKKKIKSLLQTLRKIRDSEEVSDELFAEFFDTIEFDVSGLAKEMIRRELEAEDQVSAGNPAIRNIPIKITTIQSSKGLADDFIFFANVDDKYLMKDQQKPTDREICSFLVGLTRARKKVFLISSEKKMPTFLSWVSSKHIEAN